jgi:hypothetical protein
LRDDQGIQIMPNKSPPAGIAELAHQVGIITLDQLRECIAG